MVLTKFDLNTIFLVHNFLFKAKFVEVQQQQQHQADPQAPPPPAPLSTLPSRINANLNNLAPESTATHNNISTLPTQTVGSLQPSQTLQQQQLQQQQHQHSLHNHHHHTQKSHTQRHSQTQQRLPHPPTATIISTATVVASLPPPLHIQSQISSIKQASVKLIEGYSDPKDSKRHKKVYHKKAKRRAHKNRHHQQQQQKQQNSQQQQQQSNNPQTLTTTQTKEKDKRSNYSSGK